MHCIHGYSHSTTLWLNVKNKKRGLQLIVEILFIYLQGNSNLFTSESLLSLDFGLPSSVFCLLYFTNDLAFSTAAASPARSFPPAVA
jgi:hypothetical protein